MRANGVPNFPDLNLSVRGLGVHFSRGPNGQTAEVNGVPVNAPAFRKAMQTCHKDVSHRTAPSSSRLASTESRLLAFAKCMRGNGVPQMADPTVTTTPNGPTVIGIGGGDGVKGLADTPAFKHAEQICGSPLGPRTGG